MSEIVAQLLCKSGNPSTKWHFHRVSQSWNSISTRATIQNSICLKWQIVYSVVQTINRITFFSISHSLAFSLSLRIDEILNQIIWLRLLANTRRCINTLLFIDAHGSNGCMNSTHTILPTQTYRCSLLSTPSNIQRFHLTANICKKDDVKVTSHSLIFFTLCTWLRELSLWLLSSIGWEWTHTKIDQFREIELAPNLLFQRNQQTAENNLFFTISSEWR